MTTLGDILDEIRALYLARLSRVVSEQGVIAEPVLVDEQGRVVCEGRLGLGVRVDATGAEGPLRVGSEEMLDFAPVCFSWGTALSVEVHPFTWDCVEVLLEGRVEYGSMVAWFERWFDADDEREADDTGLHGVVHYLSDADEREEGVVLGIDLGSAPVEAFEELLDACGRASAGKVVIRKG